MTLRNKWTTIWRNTNFADTASSYTCICCSYCANHVEHYFNHLAHVKLHICHYIDRVRHFDDKLGGDLKKNT